MVRQAQVQALREPHLPTLQKWRGVSLAVSALRHVRAQEEDMIAYLLSLLLHPATVPPAIQKQVEYVESGHKPFVVSRAGCVGLMQVCPRYSQVPRLLLFVPVINRAEGCKMLAYWHKRAGGNWQRALAGYRCGNAGLRGKCGDTYAKRILSVAGGL